MLTATVILVSQPNPSRRAFVGNDLLCDADVFWLGEEAQCFVAVFPADGEQRPTSRRTQFAFNNLIDFLKLGLGFSGDFPNLFLKS